MTDAERAKLIGNELTTAVDAFVATFGLRADQHAALSDVLAAALGRATALAAGAVVSVDRKVDEVAHRLDGQGAKLSDIQRRINGRAGQLDDALNRIAALEQKQVGDGS